MFHFSKVFVEKNGFFGQEKWIHFLILWIVLKNETSLPSRGPSHPDPQRGARDSLYVVRAFPPPPPKKILATPLTLYIIGLRKLSNFSNLKLFDLGKLKFTDTYNYRDFFQEQVKFRSYAYQRGIAKPLKRKKCCRKMMFAGCIKSIISSNF